MDPIVLDKIESETKKEPKHAALRLLKEDTLRFLKLVCDPLVTFGVTVDQDYMADGWKNCTSRMKDEQYSDALYDLCTKLADRTYTGNIAENWIRNLLIEAPTVGHLKWTCRFLNRTSGLAFLAPALNKIWPGFIEEFEVALATPYDPDRHEITGEYYDEPKLDGLRMVILDGKAYTRNGHQIESVQHIIDEIGEYLDLKMYVLDGEIMGAGDFDEASGKIRKKDNGPNEQLYYNLFDMVTITEWENQKSLPFKNRRANLEAAIKESANVKLVPSTSINFKTPATGLQLNEIRDRFMALGYEGGMLKDAACSYEWKRGLAIIKLKKMENVDGRIVGTYEGKGRHKGRLGGIEVEVEGVVTKVGSGFSDDERERFWKIRNELVDQMTEIQYQNKTKDGRLRFPVYLKLRPDKT